MGGTAPHRPYAQSGVLLDSQLLLNEKLAVLRDPLGNFSLCTSWAHSFIRKFYLQSLIWSAPAWITEAACIWGCPWGASRRFSSCKKQWCGHLDQSIFTPLISKLRWLPVCFQVQFKVLVMTPKGIGRVIWGTAFPQLHLPIPSGLAQGQVIGPYPLRNVIWWDPAGKAFLPWHPLAETFSALKSDWLYPWSSGRAHKYGLTISPGELCGTC